MSENDRISTKSILIQQAHTDVLYRDLHLINDAVRRELGPLPAREMPPQTKRKPELSIGLRAPTSNSHIIQETNDVSVKHLTAAATIAVLGLAACQQNHAASASQTAEKPIAEQATPAPASDMQTAAAVFASDKGRDWDAYSALTQVKWVQPAPKEFATGRYSRSGEILLQGFGIKDIPNGKPGTDYATEKRNEGESILTATGTLSGVESVSIAKPLYSDDYLHILKTQFGSTANVTAIADQCPAPEYEEGAGNGAFFEVSLSGGNTIYVQASQKDGGKYTDGFTVFDLTRTRPSDAIAELHCKPVK